MTIKRVFAIGNGESRKSINLNELRPHGIIYGCNGLYRDFQPDALVVVDPAMKTEIWNTDYLLENKAYFKDWTDEKPLPKYGGDVILPTQPGVLDSPKKIINSNDVIARKFPDDVFRIGYASGPASVLIASIEEEPDEVYLIGHDLYTTTEYFNNVYKDTENYLGTETPPCPPDNWITQLKWCFNDFNTIQFYHVNPLKEKHLPVTRGGGPDVVTVQLPAIAEEWNQLENIHPITLDEMWKRLNR